MSSSYIGKSDAELGRLVHEHLIRNGLETPIVDNRIAVSDEEKIDAIRPHFKEIMEVLGLDLSDDSLNDTPSRVAKMFVREIFWGLDYSKFPKCTTVSNKMNYNNSFVMERNVTLNSTCEHHFVTISGKCAIAYIPRDTVIGLSKLNRIVSFFSKRPQIQERLGEQIAETVSFVCNTPDVACYIDAVHYCVRSRGIEDASSSTVTLSTRGKFAEPTSEVRTEFLAIARQALTH